jgi:HK97 family phage portal protein
MGLISNIRDVVNIVRAVRSGGSNALDDIVRRLIGGNAIYPDYNSDTYLEAYTDNGGVFTIINKITEPASIVPIYQYDENDKMVENGRMIQLLNNPNPYQSREEYIEAFLSFFLIFGDAYAAYQSIPNGMNANLPLRLDTLPSPLIQINLGTVFDPIAGYKYVISGNEIDYTKEQVLHWKEFNPKYDHQLSGHLKGMSRLRPLLKSIIGSGSAYDSMVAAFQHQGAFGILTLLGEDGKANQVSKEHLSAIEQKYTEKYTGVKNAGKIVLTKWDHKWTNFGMNARDMKIIESLGVFKGEIADAYNVPGILLAGSQDRTFLNYKEAKKALWSDAICPNLDTILEKHTKWLAPYFKGEEKHYLKADYSGIDVLQKDVGAMVQWMVTASCFTGNQILEACDFEKSKDPNMDRVIVGAGKTFLDELGLMPSAPLTEEVMKRLRMPDYRQKN